MFHNLSYSSADQVDFRTCNNQCCGVVICIIKLVQPLILIIHEYKTSQEIINLVTDKF